MSYKLTKDNEIRKITYLSYNFDGIVIKPKNLNKKNIINASKIIIISEEHKNFYTKKMLDKKLKKIYALIFDLLNNDETDSTDIVNVLNEVDRLKSIIFNKYKEYLSEKEIELTEKKLELVSTELKKRLVDIEVNKMFKTNTNIFGSKNKSR